MRYFLILSVLVSSTLSACTQVTQQAPLDITTEPPGPNCPYGGKKITLEMQTFYTCNSELGGMGTDGGSTCTAINGDYTLQNDADVAALENSGCTSITGILTISNGIGTVSLTHITSVGMLAIATTAAPATGEAVTGISALSMPNLKEITIEVNIHDNPKLSSLDLPQVDMKTASVFIVTQNPKLPTCQVQKLEATLSSTCNKQVNNNDSTATCP